MRRTLALAALALTGLAAQSDAQFIYGTGFESPMTLGDLAGQDDWMVTPKNAAGTIQNVRVFSGEQAVELVDGASFGRAQKNISLDLTEPVLVGTYSMYLDDTWANDIETDRFEAQNRIEGSGNKGTFGIEFGYLIAPPSGYESVPGGAAAFFLEIGSESAMMGSAYAVVDPLTVVGGWHTYRMTYDNPNDVVKLFVDGALKTQVTLADDILSVSGVQMQNQRWGTSPQKNASLYFDDVKVEAVPEPASLFALGLGAAALARRRRAQ